MNLSQVAKKYIGFKQSLGMNYREPRRILKSFCRTMGNINMLDVNPDSVLSFISGTGPVTRNWHSKFSALKGFYHFAVGRGYADFSPLPATIPKRPQTSPAYIYTTEELNQLLEATDILKTNYSPLQAITYRTLLLTLYGTAIRIGEAISLTLADVDLSDRLLTIRNTKFYKSRLVPMGPKLSAALEIYKKKRCNLPRPAGKDSAFFVSRTGNALIHLQVLRIFRRLREHAGIHRDDGRYQPRIHDIRHTSAVHRLVAWYREGIDVGHMLQLLATYMGHTGIKHTQHYLSIIPELQNEALSKFERYALLEENNG